MKDKSFDELNESLDRLNNLIDEYKTLIEGLKEKHEEADKLLYELRMYSKSLNFLSKR